MTHKKLKIKKAVYPARKKKEKKKTKPKKVCEVYYTQKKSQQWNLPGTK